MSLLWIGLLLIPIIALSIYETFLSWAQTGRWGKLFSALLWLAFIVSAFFSYYAFKVNFVYGLSHYLVALATSILITIETSISEKRPREKWGLFETGILSSVLALLIMFIVVIPVAVIPNISGDQKAETALPPSQISAEPIIESLDSIKESILNVEGEFMQLYTNIDTLSSTFIMEIQKRNDELRKLSEEQDRVLSELEYYKSLASLTEEQAAAVIGVLNRSRYIDYGVGILIGLSTGGLFFAFQYFYLSKRTSSTMRRLKKKAK